MNMYVRAFHLYDFLNKDQNVFWPIFYLRSAFLLFFMFILGKGLNSFVNLFVAKLLFMKIVSFESILIKNFILFKF